MENGQIGHGPHVARPADQAVKLEGDNVSTQIQPTKASRVQAQAHMQSPAIMVTVSVSFYLPLMKNVFTIK